MTLLGFQIFMAAMMLLIPAVMLGFGHYWQKNPPNHVNGTYGYRSRRSMFSKRTWDYAHEVCAKTWCKFGWWTLVVTVAAVAAIFVFCHDVDSAGIFGGIVVLLQLIPMLTVIPITEHALKRKFGI